MFMLSEYSMLSSTSTTLVFGVFFLFLAKQNNKKYMTLWGISWIIYSLMFFLDFSNLIHRNQGTFYISQRLIISLIGSFVFLLGTHHFFQLKPSKYIYLSTIGFFMSLCISAFSHQTYLFIVMPNVIYSSFLLIWSGCMFISYSWTQNLPEKIIASFLMILWAIFLNHFGFSLNHEAMAIFNYYTGLFMVNLLILFLMIIHFKKLRFFIEKREENFRLLVENASDSMFLFHYEKQAFQYVSPSIQPLLGVSPKELYENPSSFFKNIKVSEAYTKSLIIFSKPVHIPDMALLCYVKNGSVSKWSEMHYLPIMDSVGNVTAIEGILRDITEQVKTEKSLKASEAARKELIENISHEVRTPVTLIQGYTESLLNDVVPVHAKETYLKMIHSKTMILTNLLEDLIQVSHFTSQTLDYKFYEQNAYQYFANIINQAEFQIVRSGKSVKSNNQIDANAVIILDASRIEQVITNIVNNSLRHTPQGGSISLFCTSYANSPIQPGELGSTDPLTIPDGEIIFSVADNGEGIHPDDIPHIFERKFQGKNRISVSGTNHGSGLGLFISMQIIKQHSGKIWAENKESGGAQISFSIPYYTNLQ